jgi:hypothetical protein
MDFRQYHILENPCQDWVLHLRVYPWPENRKAIKYVGDGN